MFHRPSYTSGNIRTERSVWEKMSPDLKVTADFPLWACEHWGGPPPWEHALSGEDFSVLREPFLMCPGALESTWFEEDAKSKFIENFFFRPYFLFTLGQRRVLLKPHYGKIKKDAREKIENHFSVIGGFRLSETLWNRSQSILLKL